MTVDAPELLILDTTVALPGATAAGFHGLERTEDRAFRWTTGEARIDVPIDRETPPAALDMDVVMTGPPKWLRIEADGCVLFDDTISGRWAESFALDSCRLTPPSLEIRLASDTHEDGSVHLRTGNWVRPASSNDRRERAGRQPAAVRWSDREVEAWAAALPRSHGDGMLSM